MKPIAAMLILMALPAQAQTNCGQRQRIIMELQLRFEETQVGAGMNGTGDAMTVFEMWASPDLGTWTILRTYPDGMACVLATGQAWVSGDKGPAF